jgi:hypothetical protein
LAIAPRRRFNGSITPQFYITEQLYDQKKRQVKFPFSASWGPNKPSYIVPLIGGAVRGTKIDVMSDHAGYAIYSRPEEYRTYRCSLEEAQATNSSVKMLVYDRKLSKHALKIQ